MERAQIAGLGLAPTPEKMRVLDFTSPIVILPYQFVVPKPEEESHLLGPIRLFQQEVRRMMRALN